MARRVSSPVFVGRRRELDGIAAALDAAADGHGSFLLVGGEAGVGKTRLLEESAGLARSKGFAVGLGRCRELGVSGLPFAPIRAALRDVVGSLDAADDPLLAGLAAEAMLSPGLTDARPSAERIGLVPDTSQSRMFEASLDLLRRLSLAGPILLMVEDLHWADASTLDLLEYLAPDIEAASLVVLATFRSDELHRRHPLQPFLGEIQRVRSIDRMDLGRFSEGEVAEQLSSILGEPVPPDLVGRVYQRSNGNAFYAEELVAAGQQFPGLPPAMRDVLLTRVATLGTDARELLGVLAVGGTRVATELVARAAETGPGEVDATLRDAVDRHLIRPIDDDGTEYLEFRHALVQEAVYEELLPGERTRLHARYGVALEGVHEPGDAASPELAYHWYAAHDVPRALLASVEAGGYSASNRAYGDAHQHYERALELWDRVPDAGDRTGIDRIALLELAARTASESDPARAAALMLDAVRSEGATTDPTRLALLKERQGRYAWLAGDGVTGIEACREAVALLSDDTPMRARARVLASLGQILLVTIHPDEGRTVCERAIAAARAAGDAEVEAHALDSLGGIYVYLGDLEAGVANMNDAIDLALSVGSVDEASRAQVNLVDALAHSGRLAEAGDEAAVAYVYAERHGLARRMGVIDLTEGALALYRLGDWDRAREFLDLSSSRSTSGIPRIMVEERMALLDVGQGRFDVAAHRIAVTRPLIERVVEAQFVAPLVEAAVELALWRGEPTAARAEIQLLFERLKPVPAYISRLGPVLALGVRTEADLGELARARHDEEAVAESRSIAAGYLDTLRSLKDAAADRFPNFLSQAEAWLGLGEAEAARLEGRDTQALWGRSASAFEAVPMAYARAYALWRGAAADLARNRDRAAATAALGEARVVATELQAVPLLAEIDALVRRAHLELGGGKPVADTTVAAAPLGLTQREREILALLAVGRSNREIAETLFITEGTAGTHVSNILGKLGVRGRTEAATMAYRLGLVE